ncbi:hypothetical protein Goshw_020236, partial [Gossypium schwendimanii]|nr:hypothetical protein [Gossypium schwendimanii]
MSREKLRRAALPPVQECSQLKGKSGALADPLTIMPQNPPQLTPLLLRKSFGRKCHPIPSSLSMPMLKFLLISFRT